MSAKHVVLISFLLIPSVQGWSGWNRAGAPRKLVGGQEQSYLRPVWSPQGDLIAFTGTGYQGIQVLDPATGEIKQITDERAAGFGFCWSHDGSAIAARTARYEKRRRLNDVKVFELATGKFWSISGTRSRFKGVPRWTKDDRAVYILGKRQVQVLESGLPGVAPAEPASDRLYLLKTGKIAVGESSGTVIQMLDPLAGRRYLNLSLSPDGSKMAFEVVGGNLHVMNVDGTGLVDLGAGFRPGWSPAGKWIIYQVSEDDGHAFTSSDVFVIKTDGSEKTNLTQTADIYEMNPAWSPTADRIAFDVGEAGAIYVMDIEQN